jgi:hypothetical protein
MTEERAAKQRELLTPYIAEADVLITTAACARTHCTSISNSANGGTNEAWIGNCGFSSRRKLAEMLKAVLQVKSSADCKWR